MVAALPASLPIDIPSAAGFTSDWVRGTDFQSVLLDDELGDVLSSGDERFDE